MVDEKKDVNENSDKKEEKVEEIKIEETKVEVVPTEEVSKKVEIPKIIDITGAIGEDGKPKRPIVVNEKQKEVALKAGAYIRINSLDEATMALKGSEGYMLGFTLLNKGKLNHYLMTSKFPLGDILKSMVKHKALAIEQLEDDSTLSEF